MNLIPPIYNYVFFPYRKRRINVITNLKTRRDAEAKLLAGQITPEDFLLAMSYHNEFQVQILQQKNKEDSSEDEDESRGEELCIICVKKKQGVHAFRPCGHALACLSCCIRLYELNTNPKCPHCRTLIDSYLSVRLP